MRATLSDSQLSDAGFEVLPGAFLEPRDALAAAWPLISSAAAAHALSTSLPPLIVVGDFSLPPPGTTQRPFQVLHLDFGLPLGRAARLDAVRYTVLHVDAAASPSGAMTRIIALADLACQRAWPTPERLADGLIERDSDPDDSEGVLARIVAAADGVDDLPSKTSCSFRCGLEFGTIDDEEHYFAAHGVSLVDVEHRVRLHPGQAMVFDNLRCAHGRLGVRAAEELRQMCVGHADLDAPAQRAVLLHSLEVLTGNG